MGTRSLADADCYLPPPRVSQITINGAWGLGENVVQGAVNPDEWRVFKPSLAKPGTAPIITSSTGSKKMRMICEWQHVHSCTEALLRTHPACPLGLRATSDTHRLQRPQ